MPDSKPLRTRTGTCLEDRRMLLYDHEQQKRVQVDWKKKDYPFERINPTFREKAVGWTPFSEHIIPEFTPISDQGHAGTCVANAGLDMFEILLGLEDPKSVKQLSRRFGYWISRHLTGDTDREEGTYIRALMHQLKNVGIFEEEYFKYSDKNDDLVGKGASPRGDHYTMASDNKLHGFYRIDVEGPPRLTEIELAIRANHPVIFGTPVSGEFQAYRGASGVAFSPPPRLLWVGRHAMLVVGIRYVGPTRQFLVRNSWSKHWGNDGHCWMSEEYFLWDETQDLWVGTRTPPII